MATPDLKIIRIVANPPGPDRAIDKNGRYLGKFINLNEEFVEIKNFSSSLIKLDGYSLTDNKNHLPFIFPQGADVGKEAVIRIRTGHGMPTSTDFYWNRDAPVWNNEGDTAILKDPRGSVASSVKLAKIYGYVYDKDTNIALAGANLQTDSGDSAKTNPSGYYELMTMPGEPEITVSKSGYQNVTEKVQVALKTEHDFYLLPTPSAVGSQKEEPKIKIVFDSADLPKPAYIKQAYSIVANFKNNGDAINYFESHLFENNKEVDEYITGADINSAVKATYQLPAKDWSWYHTGLDTLGYAHLRETKKKFTYDATYFGKQDGVQGKLEGSKIGIVTVIVPQDKLNAFDDYNNANTALLAATAAAVASAIGTALSDGIWEFVSGGATATAIVAAVAAQFAKDGALNNMNDPIVFDRNFNKPYNFTKIKYLNGSDSPVCAMANAVSEFARLLDARRTILNRLYTANAKGDMYYEKLHLKNLKQINVLLNKNKKKLKIFKSIKYGKISSKEFKEIQARVKKHGLPKPLIKALLRSGVPRNAISFIGKVLPKLPIKKDYLDLNKAMQKVIVSLENWHDNT